MEVQANALLNGGTNLTIKNKNDGYVDPNSK